MDLQEHFGSVIIEQSIVPWNITEDSKIPVDDALPSPKD